MRDWMQWISDDHDLQHAPREESSQIDIILQYKLLAAILIAVDIWSNAW